MLSEMLPVFEADAPAVSDAVGEADCVLLPLSVVLAVAVTVGVAGGVPEGVTVPVGDKVPLELLVKAVQLGVGVGVELMLETPDKEADPEPLTSPVPLPEALLVAVPPPLLPLAVPLSLPRLVPDPMTVATVLPLAAPVPVPHPLAVALPQAVLVPTLVEEPSEVAVGATDSSGEALVVADQLDTALAVAGALEVALLKLVEVLCGVSVGGGVAVETLLLLGIAIDAVAVLPPVSVGCAEGLLLLVARLALGAPLAEALSLKVALKKLEKEAPELVDAAALDDGTEVTVGLTEVVSKGEALGEGAPLREGAAGVALPSAESEEEGEKLERGVAVGGAQSAARTRLLPESPMYSVASPLSAKARPVS